MADTTMVRREENLPEKAAQRPTVTPAVDIYENDEEILLIADFPGVAKDQVSVNLDRDVLTIEGRRVSGIEKGPISTEYPEFELLRSFTLPSGVDPDKVSAKIEHGVLQVHLPKHAALRPRKIDIRG